MSTLWSVAKDSLEANCVQSASGPITVAGSHQFKTFWVRDFCFAVPGLLALGHDEQVRKQLALCLDHQRADGLIARGFDVINPKLRVVAESFRVPWFRSWEYGNRPLKPEYLGEHGTPAVDSNLLTMLACDQWMRKNESSYFLEAYGAKFEKALDFILRSSKESLLTQPAFSDWQDSARRDGHTFYLNLLFLRVLKRLQAREAQWAMKHDAAEWTNRLWRAFFDSNAGLFRNRTREDRYSLETQLWCIEEDLFSEHIPRAELWRNLKASALWTPLPGRPVAPEYAGSEISWTTKFVGLRHYHDRFYWSWLMGESLKVAKLMGDSPEVQKIANALERLASVHGTIHEIYELQNELLPVKRTLYKSERPFSWGAAKILEALAT